MGKGKKSTRKFVKKHLGEEIAKRRKHKQLAAQRSKPALSQSLDGDDGDTKAGQQAQQKRVEDMDVDELLRGDFLDGSELEEADEEEEEEELDEDEELLEAEDEEEEEEEEEGRGGTGMEESVVDITPPDLEDSSEEEGEPAEGSVRWHNRTMESEIKHHKEQLEALKEKDPEFYQFLQEHDQELLEFSEDEEEREGVEEEEEGPEDSGGRVGEEEGGEEASRGRKTLTTAMVDGWCTAAKEKHSIGAVRNLLRAFRSACHYGEGEGEDMQSPFSIASSHVFNRVMLFTLKEIDGILRALLERPAEEDSVGGGPKGKGGKGGKGRKGADQEQEGKEKGVEKSPRWKKVEPLAKSYLGNALHILGQMSDSAMIAFTLKRLRASVPLLGPFPKLTRKLLKLVLHLWGSGEGALPLLALLFIRELAVQLPRQWLEECLKGVYRTFSANAKFVTASSMGRLAFLGTCVVEMYGLDPGAAYLHVFVYVRQLALVLRNALTMKTKEASKGVYCWQYLNCLQLWVRVLAAPQQQEALRPLAYPLSQIILGAARLVPTARYFPLRLLCARMLHQLAAASGHYIPVAGLLLEMLQMKELRQAPTAGAGSSMDLHALLKVPKPVLKTRAFQESVVDTVLEQVAQHLAQWAFSIAFPELCLLPLVHLRRFLKDCKVERFRRQTKQLVDQIERTVELVAQKRESVTFSPKDTAAAASFLEAERAAGASPLVKYAATLAQRAEQQRAHLLSSSVVVGGERGRSKGAKRQRGGDEEDSGEEGGDDGSAAAAEEASAEGDGESAFSTGWLPPKQPKRAKSEKAKVSLALEHDGNDEDDVVEDLMLSEEENVEDEEGDGSKDEVAPSMDHQTKRKEGERRERHVKTASKAVQKSRSLRDDVNALKSTKGSQRSQTSKSKRAKTRTS